MKLTGKLISGACFAISAGIFGWLTYDAYKELRFDEATKIMDAEEHNRFAENDDDLVEVPEEQPTASMIKAAMKKVGVELIEDVKKYPTEYIIPVTAGILSGLYYIAGTNDGFDAGVKRGEKDGYAHGVATGIHWDEDIHASANPETYEKSRDNCNLYLQLHPNARTINSGNYADRDTYKEIVEGFQKTYRTA